MLFARHLRVEAHVIDLDRGLERAMQGFEREEGVDLAPLGGVPGGRFWQERGSDEERERESDERHRGQEGPDSVHETEGDPHSPANAEEGVGTRHEAGVTAQGQLVRRAGQQRPQRPVAQPEEGVTDAVRNDDAPRSSLRADRDGAGRGDHE